MLNRVYEIAVSEWDVGHLRPVHTLNQGLFILDSPHTGLVLGGGRKLENPKKTQIDIGGTFTGTSHSHSSKIRTQPRKLEL